MAWLKALSDTYEVFEHLAGVEKDGQPVLLPIFHSTLNAQIEVTIDEDGNFISSKKVEKGNDAVTIIPVTEDSAARSSGIAPHPLCDKLCYLAGDYSVYTGEHKEDYYEQYMAQLKDWVDLQDAHFMVKAVYRYLKKGTLIHDLVAERVLELDANEKLTDAVKLHNQGQTGANVRFVVYGNDGTQNTEVWKNNELYWQYIQHCQKELTNARLCYVSGQVSACSDKHPSKIRNSGDKAKLISANDESGFTYRGRFTTKDQAASVGCQVSQKAHNALRWLLQKQGYTRDGAAIVCWMTNRDKQLPDAMKNSVEACVGMEDFEFDIENIFNEPEIDTRDTGQYFAQKFEDAINGYASKIKVDDTVAVIALDAATTGRLSIVYYDEMGGKQYMDAVLNWYKHCKWKRVVTLKSRNNEKRRMIIDSTPSPREMALSAYGIQRKDWLEADSALIRATVNRLLPCITKPGLKIPPDMIRSAARHASALESMSSFVWWNDVLCVVCAMIRYNYEKGEKSMDNFLEEHLNDRNVLFGRLWAVYDYMEQRAMFERDADGNYKEQRMTNAKRYWNAFSSRPARTAKTVKGSLISYENKLSDYELNLFSRWENEVMVCLAGCGYNNMPLSEFYLPGYAMQMEQMRNAFQKKNDKGENEDE